MGRLLAENNTQRTLVYDITRLSSSSSLIHLLEYGYSRDGLTLPQINLSLIMDKDRGIPVMYDIYPGSITDVTTLTKLEAYGVADYTAIMDRGFFSQNNLLEMLDRQISFIIAAKFSLKELKALLTEEQRAIDQVEYLQKFHDRTIYVKSSFDRGIRCWMLHEKLFFKAVRNKGNGSHTEVMRLLYVLPHNRV